MISSMAVSGLGVGLLGFMGLCSLSLLVSNSVGLQAHGAGAFAAAVLGILVAERSFWVALADVGFSASGAEITTFW